MSDLVSGGETAAAHEVQQSGELIETGSLPSIYRVDPATCTSIELDRRANRTAKRSCPREGLALRLESDEKHADLAVVAEPGVR